MPIEEAYLLAENVMTDDFNVAGGIALQEWPPPCDKKIGARARKSVSRWLFHF